jgi:hypothetical protein
LKAHRERLVKVNTELQRELDFNIHLDKEMSYKIRNTNMDYSVEKTFAAATLVQPRAHDLGQAIRI